jgi:hypothetical protein
MQAFEHSDKRRPRSRCACRSDAASQFHTHIGHHARHQARGSEASHEYRVNIACFRIFPISQLDQRRISATRKRWMTRPVRAYAHMTQARQRSQDRSRTFDRFCNRICNEANSKLKNLCDLPIQATRKRDAQARAVNMQHSRPAIGLKAWFWCEGSSICFG